MKERLIKMIEELTGSTQVSAEQQLREIGINSITYVQILISLEDELGVEFPDQFLDFEALSTVGSLAALLEGMGQQA